MAFAINFTNEPNELLGDDNTPSAIGEILLGDYRDTFAATLFEWSRPQYEASWRFELKRLLDGADRAVLLTQLLIPGKNGLPNWWALYRGEQNEVVIQEHLGINAELFILFSPQNPSDSLKDREIATNDGQPISEWIVQTEDIEAFLNSN